jgi:hypothetical protein
MMSFPSPNKFRIERLDRNEHALVCGRNLYKIDHQCPEPEVRAYCAASSTANFGFKRGTRIIELLVVLDSEVGKRGCRTNDANFGIGPLGRSRHQGARMSREQANYSADAARKPAMRMMKVAAHHRRSVGRAEIMVYTRGQAGGKIILQL